MRPVVASSLPTSPSGGVVSVNGILPPPTVQPTTAGQKSNLMIPPSSATKKVKRHTRIQARATWSDGEQDTNRAAGPSSTTMARKHRVRRQGGDRCQEIVYSTRDTGGEALANTIVYSTRESGRDALANIIIYSASSTRE
ncbi:unnamed protein product [Ectocarpus sp. 12 AP-2014]